MNELLHSVLESLKTIRRYRGSHGKPSHKDVLLLSIARLYERDPERPNRFPLDEEIETLFHATWRELFNTLPDPNAVEYPFFHLQSDGFWTLSPKPGLEAIIESYTRTRMTRRRLIDTIDYGYLRNDFHECFRDPSLRGVVVDYLASGMLFGDDVERDDSQDMDHLEVIDLSTSAPNAFVSYLNTLHSRDAGNENALAEAQACNPEFARIHVRHSLVETIVQRLTSHAGESIILTGHAGDGKSTVALSVYKQLKGLDQDAVLSEPLRRKEVISLPDGTSLTIIKDLSEWTHEERDSLLSEALAGSTRVLLVTNTGVLLETFCDYAERHQMGSRIEWEPRLLDAMDAEANGFKFGPIAFWCFNLALHDNLFLARCIFERMLSDENWRPCHSSPCHTHCPIIRNVHLLQRDSCLAIDRLFLAYRRMYEYGTRLTIRQLTAHLAYLLTAGLEYADIRALMERADRPLMAEFLFCNRFFGDDGRTVDAAAVRMRVVREVRQQGFGERPCPNIERHLWLLTHAEDYVLGVPEVERDFGELRRVGSRSPIQGQAVTPDQARLQVRRMLYFLHRFADSVSGDSFLRQFLNSLAILRWQRWQDPNARLSMDEASNLAQRVFHVLQEQFAGVRLPELGGLPQSHLYITLSRNRHDIRQSAQVVLALIDFANEFRLGLSANEDSGIRRDLFLIGQGGRLNGVRLPLKLPFLDYVLARHQGEVSETLQASFADRLERLKAELVQTCRSDQHDEMLLVRLRTNHAFARQLFAVTTDGKLEVSNA